LAVFSIRININNKLIFEKLRTFVDTPISHIYHKNMKKFEIDNSILSSPLWIPVSEACWFLERSDRTVRDMIQKYKWDKKYAEIDGMPHLFVRLEQVLLKAV